MSKSEWLEEHITFALVQAILNQMHLKMLDNTMEEDDTRVRVVLEVTLMRLILKAAIVFYMLVTNSGLCGIYLSIK